eukprot:5888235-Pyramimonas_sp.AAC.1
MRYNVITRNMMMLHYVRPGIVGLLRTGNSAFRDRTCAWCLGRFLDVHIALNALCGFSLICIVDRSPTCDPTVRTLRAHGWMLRAHGWTLQTQGLTLRLQLDLHRGQEPHLRSGGADVTGATLRNPAAVFSARPEIRVTTACGGPRWVINGNAESGDGISAVEGAGAHRQRRGGQRLSGRGSERGHSPGHLETVYRALGALLGPARSRWPSHLIDLADLLLRHGEVVQGPRGHLQAPLGPPTGHLGGITRSNRHQHTYKGGRYGHKGGHCRRNGGRYGRNGGCYGHLGGVVLVESAQEVREDHHSLVGAIDALHQVVDLRTRAAHTSTSKLFSRGPCCESLSPLQPRGPPETPL